MRAARRVDGASVVTFTNPEQQLHAAFAAEAVTIRGRDKSQVAFTRARLGRDGALLALSEGPVAGVGTADVTIARMAGNVAVTEWWRNRADGLEQGFTVATRPDGDGALELNQTWEGDLEPRVDDDGLSVVFLEGGAERLRYAGLKAFDSTGRVLAARMDLSATRQELRFIVDDSGAAYPITIDPIWSQQAYLKASNTEASDAFGQSVAVSGNTLVVGAPFEESGATGVNGNQADNSADEAGAAYVFVRAGTTWTQQAYLKASNAEAGDQFGKVVGISGDTVVVGTSSEESNATGVNGDQADNSFVQAGAAYVFVRAGTTWTQQAYLKASNTGVADNFGYSVAISGDTVVVGAVLEDSGAIGVNGNQADNSAGGSGAAYVFVRGGTSWTQQAYLKASNTGVAD